MKNSLLLFALLVPMFAFAGGGGDGFYDEDEQSSSAGPVLLAKCTGPQTMVKFTAEESRHYNTNNIHVIYKKQRYELVRNIDWLYGAETEESRAQDFFRDHDYINGVSAKKTRLAYNLVEKGPFDSASYTQVSAVLTAEIELDGAGGFLKAWADQDGDGKMEPLLNLQLTSCELF